MRRAALVHFREQSRPGVLAGINVGAGWPIFFTEYLFGSEDSKPPFGYWSGIDYGRSEVRD